MRVTVQDKRTPLLKAAESSQLLAAKLLIERGADLEATTARGNTALALAMMSANAALVQLLVANGAKVDTLNAVRRGCTCCTFCGIRRHLVTDCCA